MAEKPPKTKDEIQKELKALRTKKDELQQDIKTNIEAAKQKGVSETEIDELHRKIEATKQKIEAQNQIAETKKAAIGAMDDASKKTPAQDPLEKRLQQLGLVQEDFGSIPEWEFLSKSAKMLTLEKAAQYTLSHVKETAEKRFAEKNQITGYKNPLKWKPGSTIGKLSRKLTKTFWISKEEKQAINEVRNGEAKPDPQVLQQLSKQFAEMRLPVVEKEGEPVIEFLHIHAGLNPETAKIFEEYNTIANEFASLPDAWKNKRAASSKDTRIFSQDHKKYNEIEAKYELARSKVIEQQAKELQDRGSDEKRAISEAMLRMSTGSDMEVAMLQLLNTNPNVLQELNRIENEASWQRFINNENIGRAMYIGIGKAIRAGLTYTIGAFAAPITAGVIGGIRARQKAERKINTAFSGGRGERTFREMTAEERKEQRGYYYDDEDSLKLAALGKNEVFNDKNVSKKTYSKILDGREVNAKNVAGFIDADSQMHRINLLMDRIRNPEPKDDRDLLRSQLAARIDFIEQKHQQGLINYGTENPMGTGYTLMKLISEAEVEASYYTQTSLAVMETIQSELFKYKKPYAMADNPSLTDMHEYLNLKLGYTTETEVADAKRDIRLEKMMRKVEEQLEKNQKNFKNWETGRGVVMGATFGTLGYKIKDWVQHFGLDTKVEHWAKDIFGHHGKEAAVSASVATSKALHNTPINTTQSGSPLIRDIGRNVPTQQEPTDDVYTSTPQNIETGAGYIAPTKATPIFPSIRQMPQDATLYPKANTGSHPLFDDKNINTVPKPGIAGNNALENKNLPGNTHNTPDAKTGLPNQPADTGAKKNLPEGNKKDTVTKLSTEQQKTSAKISKKTGAKAAATASVAAKAVAPKIEKPNVAATPEEKLPADSQGGSLRERQVPVDVHDGEQQEVDGGAHVNPEDVNNNPPPTFDDGASLRDQQVNVDIGQGQAHPNVDSQDLNLAKPPKLDSNPSLRDQQVAVPVNKGYVEGQVDVSADNSTGIEGQDFSLRDQQVGVPVNGESIQPKVDVHNVNLGQPPRLGERLSLRNRQVNVPIDNSKISLDNAPVEGNAHLTYGEAKKVFASFGLARPPAPGTYQINLDTNGDPQIDAKIDPATGQPMDMFENKPNIHPESNILARQNRSLKGPELKGVSTEDINSPKPDAPDMPVVEKNLTLEQVTAPTVEQTAMTDIDHHGFVTTAGDVRRSFASGDASVAVTPDHDTYNGATYNNWSMGTDKNFQDLHVKFESLNGYRRDRLFQQLFGQTKVTEEKGSVGYDAASNTNYNIKPVIKVDVHYFRQGKVWPTVNKLPAKFFFHPDQETLAHLSTEQKVMLYDRGILDKDMNFTKHDQLLRLQQAYAKIFSEEAAKPITYGDGTYESIEHYIDRLSKSMHQTDNGTLYFAKEDARIRPENIRNRKIVADGLNLLGYRYSGYSGGPFTY